MIRKIVKPAYAAFMILFEYLKDFVSLLTVLFRVLLAKMYVKPIRNVAESFSSQKSNDA